MSSNQRHPADFLYQLASAIKAVRERGGKWNQTADTIQWAHERIERLESSLDIANAGNASHIATIKELESQIGTYKIRGDQHAESLRAIRDMCDAETVDVKRIRLWASDSLSGYTEPLESSLLKVSDERNRLRAALRWAYDRLDVDGGMTESEQRRTVEQLGNVLAGEPSRAADYKPEPDEASIRRENGQWPT